MTIKAHGVGLWAPLVGPFKMLVVDFGPKGNASQSLTSPLEGNTKAGRENSGVIRSETFTGDTTSHNRKAGPNVCLPHQPDDIQGDRVGSTGFPFCRHAADGRDRRNGTGAEARNIKRRDRHMKETPVMSVSFPRHWTSSNATTGHVISKAVPHSGRSTVPPLIPPTPSASCKLSEETTNNQRAKWRPYGRIMPPQQPSEDSQIRDLEDDSNSSSRSCMGIGSCLPSL